MITNNQWELLKDLNVKGIPKICVLRLSTNKFTNDMKLIFDIWYNESANDLRKHLNSRFIFY